MKKLALWMCVVIGVIFSGCSNVHYIMPNKECSSLTGMNICENTEDRAEIPNLDIKGDKQAADYPEYY
ncbi:MAG TPA: hypothetical protein PKV41_06770 [Candidatus Omnitrophota bacterium]|nr:hypothetical protein [Candidatus Omnitrophota bacterium]